MKYVLLQLGRLWVFRRGTQNLRCCTNRCVTLNLKNQKKLLFEYLNVFCAYWVIYLFLFAFQTLKQKVKKYILIWSNHNKFIYLNIKLNDSIQNYQAKQFSMTFDKRTFNWYKNLNCPWYETFLLLHWYSRCSLLKMLQCINLFMFIWFS